MKLNISASDYSDWKNDFVKKYGRYSKAIYELGNVSYPGLSDIDLLVIPDTSNGFVKFDVMKDKDLSLLPFCLHNPFIVPQEYISVLEHVNFDNLNQIFGQILSLPKYIPNAERELLQFVEGAYSLIEFSRALSHAPMEKAAQIPVMSSLRFTLKYLDSIENSIRAVEYSNKFDRCRQDYLMGIDNYGEMRTLFCEYIEYVNLYLVKTEITNSHFYNLIVYRNLGLDIREVLRILSVKLEYSNALSRDNYDFGSVLRSSFFPLKKLNVVKRLYRRLLWVIQSA
jgi:hypothetical protein